MGSAREIAMAVPERMLSEVIFLLEMRRRGLHRVDAFDLGEPQSPPAAEEITPHELEELCDRVETLKGAPKYVNQMGRSVWEYFQKFGRVSPAQVATLRRFLEYKTRKMTP